MTSITSKRAKAWPGHLYAAHNPLRRFESIVAANLAADAHRILDIGCGFDTATLAKMRGRRVGVDLVRSFTPAPGVSVVRANGEQLPFSDSSFDVVCCRSVLEHVEHPDRLFREVTRVLKSGGAFVVLTPNRWDYVSIAASIIPNRWHPKVVRFLTGRDEEKTFPTLYRANTKGALTRLARNAGLAIEGLALSRQHPHYLRLNRVLYLAGVAFEQCVQRPIPALRPWILAEFRRRADSIKGESFAGGVGDMNADPPARRELR